jgi:septal ring factor EnvC (AmiA/AmiB activator)
MRRALLLLMMVAPLPALAGRPPEAIDADRGAADAEVRDLERRSRALEDQLAVRRGRLKQRLRALYKLSNGGFMRLVAGATTVDELDSRRDAVTRVVARDLDEIDAVRQEARELDLEQARRKEALARAIELGSQVALADVADASGLQLFQGRLKRPVPGPICALFGAHPSSERGNGNVQLIRRGVEMRSHAGEWVHAVAPGYVKWIGDVPGLGRGIAVDHGDGWLTLTARISDVSVTVGAAVTDNMKLARATGATVYFELAQGGTPIDPNGWLVEPRY